MTKSSFEEAWRKAKKTIFRLEALPEYNVAGDLTLFERWKKGKLELNRGSKIWLNNLKKTKEKGVKIQRVRVFPSPISDYIKYEIDFWKYSSEEITFLEEKEYKKIIEKSGFIPKDFWLFDDDTLFIFYYDKEGHFIKEELISDEVIINGYLKLKKKLLDDSHLMNI
jgi:hypothetical protein